MISNQLIAVESRNGVTLYGRVVNAQGKIGQYEVHSDFVGTNGVVYHLYAEAEQRMNAVAGAKRS